ncbi:hypothetical protein Dimus_005237 [Dionaea muscipula]
MALSSASYIHMVQHLIEECIVFNMSKEECIEALSKHANIKPVITCTGSVLIQTNAKMWHAMQCNIAMQCGMNWRKRTRNSSSFTQHAGGGGADRNQSQVVGVEGDETQTRVQLRDHQFVHMKTRLDVSPSDSSYPADD